MKDLRFRQLEKYRVGGTRDRMQLSLPALKSPSGKVYQYSPNPVATLRLFLLGEAPEDRTIAEEHQPASGASLVQGTPSAHIPAIWTKIKPLPMPTTLRP